MRWQFRRTRRRRGCWCRKQPPCPPGLTRRRTCQKTSFALYPAFLVIGQRPKTQTSHSTPRLFCNSDESSPGSASRWVCWRSRRARAPGVRVPASAVTSAPIDFSFSSRVGYFPRSTRTRRLRAAVMQPYEYAMRGQPMPPPQERWLRAAPHPAQHDAKARGRLGSRPFTLFASFLVDANASEPGSPARSLRSPSSAGSTGTSMTTADVEVFRSFCGGQSARVTTRDRPCIFRGPESPPYSWESRTRSFLHS